LLLELVPQVLVFELAPVVCGGFVLSSVRDVVYVGGSQWYMV
jgi:hypothetical protein